MSEDKLLSATKTAQLLGIRRELLKKMVSLGHLHVISDGRGRTVFSSSEVDDLLAHKDGIPLLKKNDTVSPKNTLNDLTGGEWLPETKSFFYQKGLGANSDEAQIERQHPAPYSFQDITRLITFFTKKGMTVLDPFGGVGSTAKAAELSGRHCLSIELSKKYHDLSVFRLEKEVGTGASKNHTFINGDSVQVLRGLEDESLDFVVTSPPYWSILNKKLDYKTKGRAEENLDTHYSNNKKDLGNVESYEEFLDILVDKVFMECARVLRTGKYMCLVVSDFRNKSEYISFHSDLIQRMKNRLIGDGKSMLQLQGIRLLLQNHKSLLPYGYPYAFVENIHHQDILIFRKIPVKQKRVKK